MRHGRQGAMQGAMQHRPVAARAAGSSQGQKFYDAGTAEREYKPLLSELLAAEGASGVRSLAASRPLALTSAFQFWLSDAARKARGGAGERERLSRLTAELVQLKEWQDWQTSKNLLPAMASSLAYKNYRAWQADSGGASAPDPVEGVDIEELYKLGQREEAKMCDGTSVFSVRAGSSSSSSSSSGSSDSDSGSSSGGAGRGASAQGSEAYRDMAAAAMERTRARLLGYDDADTAGQVLNLLLTECCGREERASTLPEALRAPGLSVEGSTRRVCTTPDALAAEIRARMRGGEGQGAAGAAGTAGGTSAAGAAGAAGTAGATGVADAANAAGAAGGRPLGGGSAAGAGGVQGQALLPSGEPLSRALAELAEDLDEYDTHVLRRRGRWQ
ncbi:hypothetical protein FOA52_008818 [Chlamydomonas sp. UWO 241]|nr:hypothetical protein FOA52_008818 [Chlamydomonas sp. UWO 241]